MMLVIIYLWRNSDAGRRGPPMSLIDRDNKVGVGLSLFAVVIFKSQFLIRLNNRYRFGQCAIAINTIRNRSGTRGGSFPRQDIHKICLTGRVIFLLTSS